MIFERIWWTANKWTFNMKPVMKLIKTYTPDGKNWIDPFAGKSAFAEFRNDLNPENEQPSQKEAIDFLSEFNGKVCGAIFDPPYSPTQVSRSYNDMGLKFKGKENPTGGYPKVRDRLAEIIKPDGICISFGWNSCGLGKGRGFKIIEILLINHGGYRNDTIVTVEQKTDGK